jgi:hypothetical protein
LALPVGALSGRTADGICACMGDSWVRCEIYIYCARYCTITWDTVGCLSTLLVVGSSGYFETARPQGDSERSINGLSSITGCDYSCEAHTVDTLTRSPERSGREFSVEVIVPARPVFHESCHSSDYIYTKSGFIISQPLITCVSLHHSQFYETPPAGSLA